MANEIRVTSSLQIKNGNIDYQSRPTSFTASMEGSKGPSPGVLTVSIYGTLVDLSQLDVPGLCHVRNLDDTNFVTMGVYDGTTFNGLLEIGPGESYIVRLSRFLGEEFLGTGTGTTGDVNRLMLTADEEACNVVIEAFER